MSALSLPAQCLIRRAAIGRNISRKREGRTISVLLGLSSDEEKAEGSRKQNRWAGQREAYKALK